MLWFEWSTARAQLIKYTAQSPDVGFGIRLRTSEHLRWQVVRCSNRGFCELFFIKSLGCSKVCQFQKSVLHHQDIMQLNVAMYDMCCIMEVVKAKSDLGDPVGKLLFGQLLVLFWVLEEIACVILSFTFLSELKDHYSVIVLFVVFVYAKNVRMPKRF